VITPRLFRRALHRGLQWRLLLLFWASLIVPGAVAAMPVFAFLRAQLDHWPGAGDAVANLDGRTLIELARQLGENGAAERIGGAAAAAALVALLLSPFVAGATVAAARSDETLSWRQLLAGGGELYGRMLRTLLAGVLPFGVGAALTAGMFRGAIHAGERAVTETAATRQLAAAAIGASLALFLAHLVLDAARAQFAADPVRRSALAALWSGVRLVTRRPARALGLGAVGTAVGLGGAAVLMAIRLQLPQRVAPSIALAWLLAQGAQIVIGWGRAARLFGLAELARADAAARGKSEPQPRPVTQVVQSTTLSALEPPRSGASR
jgi:hypothetical protein